MSEALRIEAGAIRTLPRERSGSVPRWPLPKGSARERAVWKALWQKPQAIVWEEQGAELQVAIHVRTFVEAEEVGASASKRTLLLQQENSLLLSHGALLRAGFRITSATTTAAPKASLRPAPPSSRGRLRPVEDVGAPERPRGKD